MKSTSPVSISLDLLGRCVGSQPRWWIRLGKFETSLLADRIESISIRAPIYICGLARSGSTLLLQILAAQPEAASHHYSDFPFVFTPYWWNVALALGRLHPALECERLHGDGMTVSADSPEAIEEMLWMAFFPDCHDPEKIHVLDVSVSNPSFECFYRDHIKKLLLARGNTRYLCKGNYNITRMEYLLSLFPDARFILPIRDPVAHVGSLIRQHRRFCDTGQSDARIVRQMDIAGHFEFGLNRRPIHVGDIERTIDIRTCWANGEEVRGWALYWDMLYGFTRRQLDANPVLNKAVLIVRFEDLYAAPRETIHAVFAHCQLTPDAKSIATLASKISKPKYYRSPLSVNESHLIQSITQKTAGLYGY